MMQKTISLPELIIEWDNTSRSEKVYRNNKLIGVIIRPSNNFMRPDASINDCTLKAYTLVENNKLKLVYQIDVMDMHDIDLDDLKYVVANRIIKERNKYEFSRSVLI